MMQALKKCGHLKQALALYDENKSNQRNKMDAVSLTTVLGICTEITSIEKAKEIHENISGSKEELFLSKNHTNISLWNTLMNCYGECGDLDATRNVWKWMSDHHLATTHTQTELLEGSFPHAFFGLKKRVVRKRETWEGAALSSIGQSKVLAWLAKRLFDARQSEMTRFSLLLSP